MNCSFISLHHVGIDLISYCYMIYSEIIPENIQEAETETDNFVLISH
jgi:hypothetical protein